MVPASWPTSGGSSVRPAWRTSSTSSAEAAEALGGERLLTVDDAAEDVVGGGPGLGCQLGVVCRRLELVLVDDLGRLVAPDDDIEAEVAELEVAVGAALGGGADV